MKVLCSIDEVRGGRRKSRSGALEIARREASWINGLLAGAVGICARQAENERETIMLDDVERG